MMIKFDEIPEVENENFKGGEKSFFNRMFNDEMNKIMMGRLEPGSSIGLHTHTKDSEIIFFVDGLGTMIYDDEKFPVVAGDCAYCPKGHDHSLINDSDKDLVFYSVVCNQ